MSGCFWTETLPPILTPYHVLKWANNRRRKQAMGMPYLFSVDNSANFYQCRITRVTSLISRTLSYPYQKAYINVLSLFTTVLTTDTIAKFPKSFIFASSRFFFFLFFSSVLAFCTVVANTVIRVMNIVLSIDFQHRP